ncbi:hypothetical protein [Ahniella affigens]|nr:hypothetical protein [Ahniella affigens]
MRANRVMVIVLTLMMTLTACSGDDDASRLRANMDAMELAIESQRPGEFMDYVSDDFQSGSNGFNKEQLHAYMVGLRFRNPKLSITRGPAEIELFGDRATVRVSAVVSGGRGVMPDHLDQIHVVSHWQKIDGEWQCFGAEWDDREGSGQ